MFSFRSFVLLALVLAASAVIDKNTEWVDTPFGSRPRQCVHTWPSGSQIDDSPKEKLVRVTTPEGRVHVLPALDECLEVQAKWLKNKYVSNKEQEWQKLNVSKASRVGTIVFQDGILDDASYYTAPAYYITTLESAWNTPANPTVTQNSHRYSTSLYYYIAVENRGTDSTGPTLLESTLGFTYGKWSISSWNCCPQGQTHQSRSVTGINPGDHVSGTLSENSPVISGSWSLTSKFGTAESALTVGSLGRRFDHGHTTLDTYNVDTCEALPDASVTFSGLKVVATEHVTSLYDESVEKQLEEDYEKWSRVGGKPSPSPYNVWAADTGSTECGGVTTVKGSSTEITHRY